MWLLSLIIGVTSMSAQQYTLRGEVLDEAGDGLIGASVIVQGSTTGVMTDANGLFELKVEKGNVITVSYIGYKTQSIDVTGQDFVKL